MTKIIYAITKANWGGAQRYVHDLAIAARKEGYEVAVAVGERGLLTEKLDAAGIETIYFDLRQRRSFLSDLLTFGALFSMVQCFRRARPDIVHVNSAKAGGLGALAARLAGVPHIIFTAHGWEFNAPRSPLSKFGIRLFSWITMLLAHQTIAVSEAMKRDVEKWPGIHRRTTVIRNGTVCPLLLSRREARAKLAPASVGKYWIGMLSELNEAKCVEDAIRAFALIVGRHPDATLIVLGEGRERSKLEDLIRRLHLTKRVFLPGFRSDAPTLLNAFDLFIHTASTEALGYAILEAGCAGLPVIATRVGGIPEIIVDGEQGILVDANDPQMFAATIQSLMHDTRHAKELGARLKARVEKAFSKETMLSTTLSLYRSTLQPPTPLRTRLS